MKAIEAIWLASVVVTVIGCIYWQWRVKAHQKAAREAEEWQRYFQIVITLHRQSNGPRHSRSTLRKTR